MMTVDRYIRAKNLQSAAELLESLEGDDLVKVVAGLIELSQSAGGGWGFCMGVIHQHGPLLQCCKHPDDYYLDGFGYGHETLAHIARVVGSPG